VLTPEPDKRVMSEVDTTPDNSCDLCDGQGFDRHKPVYFSAAVGCGLLIRHAVDFFTVAP